MIKALFSGLNTIDLQFLVKEYPESNTKSKALKNGVYTGGPATNAAIAFSHLGGRATLYTPIGKHVFTSFIQNELTRFNLEIIDPVENEKRDPIFASIITSGNNGHRTIFSYFPENINDDFKENHLDILKKKDYSILLVDGFYPELNLKLAELAKQKNIPVVFDGGSWKDYSEELLNHVNIAICSEHFIPPGTSQTRDVLDFLKSKNIKKAAITRGDLPVLFYDETENGEIHVEQFKIIDTLGAGDFFHGAFCYNYAQDYNFTKALHAASKIASESCRFFGTREWINQDVNKYK
ncbi:MAG: hypothetical protein JXJ22_05490 [Bacteroidales bacterium]|nr:hypothetical protein [Bacteroidales bacterium]